MSKETVIEAARSRFYACVKHCNETYDAVEKAEKKLARAKRDHEAACQAEYAAAMYYEAVRGY